MKKIGLKHFNRLTDDFGIWQHTLGREIDRDHGYALDDSARALLVANRLDLTEKAEVYLEYLNNSTKRGVVNFFNSKRQPLPLPWSEDALGETFWALTLVTKDKDSKKAEQIAARLLPYVEKFSSVRGLSYSLIGAAQVDDTLAKDLASKLLQIYTKKKSTNWHWLEDKLTYANAIIPYSLLIFAKQTGDSEAFESALSMLDFINRAAKYEKVPICIGNIGWFRRGCKKSIFDQQPIDAAYQTIANIEAYRATGSRHYLNEAKKFFDWFWGKNIANKLLVSISSEGCLDGIREDGLSQNMGAESIVCFLLAQEEIWPYLD